MAERFEQEMGPLRGSAMAQTGTLRDAVQHGPSPAQKRSAITTGLSGTAEKTPRPTGSRSLSRRFCRCLLGRSRPIAARRAPSPNFDIGPKILLGLDDGGGDVSDSWKAFRKSKGPPASVGV